MNSNPTQQKRKKESIPEAEEAKPDEENEVGAKKRKTRLTFKPEMLTGEKGIDALMNVLTKTTFNKSDSDNLNRLVSIYQDWCRELFPKTPYDNLIEKFGVHKNVQDVVKKYRTEYTEYVRSTSDEAFEEIMSSIRLDDNNSGNNNDNNPSGITSNVIADQLNQQSPVFSPISDEEVEIFSPIE